MSVSRTKRLAESFRPNSGSEAAAASQDAEAVRREQRVDRGRSLGGVARGGEAAGHVLAMDAIVRLGRLDEADVAVGGEAHPHLEIAGMDQLAAIPAEPLL